MKQYAIFIALLFANSTAFGSQPSDATAELRAPQVPEFTDAKEAQDLFGMVRQSAFTWVNRLMEERVLPPHYTYAMLAPYTGTSTEHLSAQQATQVAQRVLHEFQQNEGAIRERIALLELANQNPNPKQSNNKYHKISTLLRQQLLNNLERSFNQAIGAIVHGTQSQPISLACSSQLSSQEVSQAAGQAVLAPTACTISEAEKQIKIRLKSLFSAWATAHHCTEKDFNTLTRQATLEFIDQRTVDRLIVNMLEDQECRAFSLELQQKVDFLHELTLEEKEGWLQQKISEASYRIGRTLVECADTTAAQMAAASTNDAAGAGAAGAHKNKRTRFFKQ